MKKSYKYYKLGYDYYQSILENQSRDEAFETTKKICIDVIGTPYMNPIYKESCIFGAEHIRDKKDKISLDLFLSSPIHLK
jgi:hypothetical protein